jgi:glucose/arabinose dehydrogenase
MKQYKFIILFFLILFISCTDSNNLEAQLQIEEAFPNLSFNDPVDIQNSGDTSNRLFVVSQPGVIYVFSNDPDVSTKKEFLNITDRVTNGGEMGLLGLAFHPNYESNGYFFVNYTANNPRRTIISRFKVSDTDPEDADENSELIILEVNQPYSNHNGGQISFGPDGYLYNSYGDGGSGGDPQNNGQNLTTLLGSLIRIDIDNTSSNLNYSIPNDNPFFENDSGYREEIYAYGLRNVWRFCFDPVTQKLWAADVGQNAWEEIDIIGKGKNYGWRVMEGLHCFNPSSGCDTTGLTMPIWEYDHSSQGGYSITGGFVYRGSNAAELVGKYIYGDYITGNIWSSELNGTSVNNDLLFNTNHNISTFGIDESNELYFASYGGSGKIYKFVGDPVNSVGSILPTHFQLYQNYPNPFNPSTIIEYELAKPSYVVLKVFSLLGIEITTLVNRKREAGLYKTKFTSSNFSSIITSGIYLYRLTTENFTSAKKMILLK